MDANVENQQSSTCVTKTYFRRIAPYPDPNDPHVNGKRKLDDTDIDSNSDDVTPGDSNLKDINDGTTAKLQSDGDFIVRLHSSPIPIEIITSILSHLNIAQHQNTIYECTLVTKQFHTIANPLLWNAPSFSDHNGIKQFMDQLSNTNIQRLSILGQYIHQLHVNQHHLMNAFLLRLSPHLSNLTHISFARDNDITKTTFEQLLPHCQQLISIQLENTRVLRTAFPLMRKYCSKLEHFQWDIHGRQSGDWMKFMVKCPLTSLELRSNVFCRHDKPEHHMNCSPLSGRALTKIQHFDRLTSLTLHLKFGDFDILDFVKFAALLSPGKTNIQTITTPLYWPHLTSLTLSPCNQVGVQTWFDFFKARPRLQQLELSDTSELDNLFLSVLGTFLVELTCLKIVGCNAFTAGGARQLIRNCGTLERFKLDGWPLITTNDSPGLDFDARTDDHYIAQMLFDQQYIDRIRKGEV